MRWREFNLVYWLTVGVWYPIKFERKVMGSVWKDLLRVSMIATPMVAVSLAVHLHVDGGTAR